MLVLIIFLNIFGRLLATCEDRCKGPHEVWDPAPSVCVRDRCEDCKCNDSSIGPPRCVCEPGYFRNDKDICIPAYECTTGCNGDPNAIPDIYPSTCRPTCSNPDITGFTCIIGKEPRGCVCKEGYILEENSGFCVTPQDCPDYPHQCKNDPNAHVAQCPNPCPPTCADPDAMNKPCIDICLKTGCECNEGYILFKKGGKCVDPCECPGGVPKCGANKTFVNCLVNCPTNCCPVDDSRSMVFCDIPSPCYPGCACEKDYLMLSFEDPRCVLASECPPVNCTRPNEVWASNPCNCWERCEDIGGDCTDFGGPSRCVCKLGYFRNYDDVCVPESECVTSCKGDANAIPNECPGYCQPTCEKPDISDEFCPALCDPSGCICKPGFILTKRGGVCVRPEECPSILGCNGDPNAIPYDCPSACPPTCDEPDTSGKPCIDMCDPSGCVCKPGFILTKKGGICIKPDKCPDRINSTICAKDVNPDDTNVRKEKGKKFEY